MMVAYGVPEIHQSLATAPLDIKEAIDWLIRIGGKDLKDNGNDKTGELLKVAKRCFQQDIMPGVPGGVESMDSMEQALQSLVEELAKFVGYDINGSGIKTIGGFGVGRRSSLTILWEIYGEDFLLCCKNDTACKSQCKCCNSGNIRDSRCDPNSCPIKKVLECSITLTGMCGEKSDRRPNSADDKIYVCCILSFLITCFSEDAQLDKASIKCNHCDNGVKYNMIHIDCHKDCKCAHTKVISKLACRINFLIQLASTINTLYINRDDSMCLTCQHCDVCNPPGYSNKCQPCINCRDGKHCDLCRTGQCCGPPNERTANCISNCESCQNCSVVRNAKAFWDMLDHVLYSCGKCTECGSTSSPQERGDCKTCSVCQGESCTDGCKYRKRFGRLICEFLHFIVYNFGDVAYALKGNISRLKDECCKQRANSTGCRCSAACCGNSTAGQPVCKDCEYYCICCVDEKHNGSCVCDNQCSEKLELLLRPALSGYVSAYDYKTATWENLCTKANGDNKGKCSDQCTESCQCYSATCPEEGCCAHCPKRKCAKILCMTMPAIYRFFDYINHQINSELQNTQGTTDSKWASALIDGDTHLGDLFRTCGFQSSRLTPRMGCDLMVLDHKGTKASCQLRDHKPGNLKDILESLQKCNASICNALHVSHVLPATTLQCRKPETVREKLLWLCGLPYSDVYEDLQNTLMSSTPNVTSGLSIMRLSLTMTTFTVHCFEDGSDSVWEYITQGFKLPAINNYLYYNPDPTRLLCDIYDAMYEVICALTFMSRQCSVSSINSGWELCKFGKDLSVYEGHRNGRCQCTTGTCRSSCPHCTEICNSCRPGARCACCCPHCDQRPDSCVCMMRFIVSTSSHSDLLTASPFCNATYGPMGFRKETLRKPQMTGAALYDYMSGLLMKDHAIYSRLLQHILMTRAGVPKNISDYYALFLRLGMIFELQQHGGGEHRQTLANAFKNNVMETFYGAHDAIMEPVVAALQMLYNQDHGIVNTYVAHNDTDSTHDASDLMSLYGCSSGVGCVGYMYALSSGPYELFSRDPNNGTDEFSNLSTKWVFRGANQFYTAMRRLTDEVNMLECCKEGGSCRCNTINSKTCECEDCNCYCQMFATLCQCGTIVKCRKMHPVLYRNGLTFHEPDMWSSRKRICKDFSYALIRFIGRDSMLCQLIEAIENFLWHIRMPFCIAIMIHWATAFCFLIYVFVGSLGRLGILSGWLSRKHLSHPLQLFTRTMIKSVSGGFGML